MRCTAALGLSLMSLDLCGMEICTTTKAAIIEPDVICAHSVCLIGLHTERECQVWGLYISAVMGLYFYIVSVIYINSFSSWQLALRMAKINIRKTIYDGAVVCLQGCEGAVTLSLLVTVGWLEHIDPRTAACLLREVGVWGCYQKLPLSKSLIRQEQPRRRICVETHAKKHTQAQFTLWEHKCVRLKTTLINMSLCTGGLGSNPAGYWCLCFQASRCPSENVPICNTHFFFFFIL